MYSSYFIHTLLAGTLHQGHPWYSSKSMSFEAVFDRIVYIFTIYGSPMLQSLDFASDASSIAIFYLNDLDGYFIASLIILIFYRIQSTLAVIIRYPRNPDLFWIALRQFFEFEIIRQSAMSHNDGYVRYFFRHIKRHEALFESVPNLCLGMLTILDSNARQKLYAKNSAWILYIISLSIGFCVVINTIQRMDKDIFKQSERHKYVGCQTGTIYRILLRSSEILVFILSWAYSFYVSFWLVIIYFTIWVGFYYHMYSQEVVVNSADIEINGREKWPKGLIQFDKDLKAKSDLDKYVFFCNDFTGIFTNLIYQPCLFAVSNKYFVRDTGVGGPISFFTQFTSQYARLLSSVPKLDVINEKRTYIKFRDFDRHQLLRRIFLLRILSFTMMNICSAIISILIQDYPYEPSLIIGLPVLFIFFSMIILFALNQIEDDLSEYIIPDSFNESRGWMTRNLHMMRELLELHCADAGSCQPGQSRSLCHKILVHPDATVEDIRKIQRYAPEFDFSEFESAGKRIAVRTRPHPEILQEIRKIIISTSRAHGKNKQTSFSSITIESTSEEI